MRTSSLRRATARAYPTPAVRIVVARFPGGPPGQSEAMRVALLGMGRMGQALGGRILDGGHDLVIWNRTPGKAPGLVARGAREAETIAAAASRAEVVIT